MEFNLLINIKMSTIVDNLISISRINFTLNWVKNEKQFYKLGPWSLVVNLLFLTNLIIDSKLTQPTKMLYTDYTDHKQGSNYPDYHKWNVVNWPN